MLDETEAQEMQRIGRSAGFLLTVALALVVGGHLTGHLDHTLGFAVYVFLLTSRLAIALAVALVSSRSDLSPQ